MLVIFATSMLNAKAMNILLYAPEYRPNLSNMIRSAEFFGFQQIHIFDKNGLLDPPSNKTSRADMNHLARVWTAGAIEFVEIIKISDCISFLDNYKGRKIATYINATAEHLQHFTFQMNDLILMGSEKQGLSTSILEKCDHAVYIPGLGQTSCLNVSVSLGILLYAAQHQQM